MNKIKAFVLSALVGLSPLGITYSCKEFSQSNTERAQQKKLSELLANKPANETEVIKNSWRLAETGIREADIQSTIDSIAFRNFYESNQELKNSAALKDLHLIFDSNHKYNIEKLPEKTRIKNAQYGQIKDFIKQFNDKLLILGMSNKEFETTHKELEHITIPEKNMATRQFKVDSMAYEQLFNSVRPMSDSLKIKFTEVCRKIRP